MHKSRLAFIFPNARDKHCEECGELSNLFHAAWGCPIVWPRENTHEHNALETREAALANSALKTERELIRRVNTGQLKLGHSLL